MARTKGAKDKKPRKRKSSLASGLKGAALGAGLVGAAGIGLKARKPLQLAKGIRPGIKEILKQSSKSAAKDPKVLGAMAAAGLLGGGAAAIRRSNKNIEAEQEEWDAMSIPDKVKYSMKERRKRKLQDRRRKEFDRRKRDALDIANAGSRVAGEVRSWKRALQKASSEE